MEKSPKPLTLSRRGLAVRLATGLVAAQAGTRAAAQSAPPDEAAGMLVPDLPGAGPAFEIAAEQFGFAPTSPPAVNAAALMAAVDWAAGRPVRIRLDGDCPCGRIDVSGQGMDLRFEGPGRLVREDGTLLTWRGGYEATQPIVAFLATTRDVEGATSPVTRIFVPDASAFARGDVVKVFSDDKDLDADRSEGPTHRRMGEFAVVVDVAAQDGSIFTAPLQHQEGYAAAPRVAKLRKLTPRISGLRARSANGNDGHYLIVIAAYEAEIEGVIEDHGQRVLDLRGGYHCKVKLGGTGYTTQPADTWGYLAVDNSGADNEFDLTGRFFRHVFTSGHDKAEPGEDAPWKYGRTRRSKVTGTADSCWGPPWDTHPGAEDVLFHKVTSLGAMTGFDVVAGVQLRGINGRVVELFCDHTFAEGVRVSNDDEGNGASGTIEVVNPVIKGPRAYTGPGFAGGAYPVVIWQGGLVSATDAEHLFRPRHSELRMVNGSRVQVSGWTGAYGSIFNLEGSTLVLDPSTSIAVSAGVPRPTEGQVVRMRSGACSFTGGFHLRHDGLVGWKALVSEGGAAPATVLFKAIIEDGPMIAATAGTFASQAYGVRCLSDQAAVHSAASWDEWAKTVGML